MGEKKVTVLVKCPYSLFQGLICMQDLFLGKKGISGVSFEWGSTVIHLSSIVRLPNLTAHFNTLCGVGTKHVLLSYIFTFLVHAELA